MFLIKNNKVVEKSEITAVKQVENMKDTPRATLQVLEEIRHDQENGSNHIDKLYALIDDGALFSEKERQELTAKGFRIFIKAQWIGKFKYHANIFVPSKVQEGVRVLPIDKEEKYQWSSGDPIQYVGDIPDSVLDKALTMKNQVCQITVHSMSPFPVKRIHCDPIMIGWVSTPQISLNHEDESFNTVRRPHVEGVVIGIWDYDKEIEALG